MLFLSDYLQGVYDYLSVFLFLFLSILYILSYLGHIILSSLLNIHLTPLGSLFKRTVSITSPPALMYVYIQLSHFPPAHIPSSIHTFLPIHSPASTFIPTPSTHTHTHYPNLHTTHNLHICLFNAKLTFSPTPSPYLSLPHLPQPPHTLPAPILTPI